MNKFCRYQYRAKDINGAHAFYTELLGEELWNKDVFVSALPERALAAGARPHWLGHIGVLDIEATANRFLAAGAQQLGPMQQLDGARFAVLVDPFGARFALDAEVPSLHRAPVVWHQYAGAQIERAWALYSENLGWTATGTQDIGTLGCQQTFAWEQSGSNVGAMWSIVDHPQVHPQWLHFFGVANLIESIARVRALGGLALEPLRTPGGAVVAVCDDAQGGAFGLMQSA